MNDSSTRAGVRSGAGGGVVHSFGRQRRAEREQGGDVRAVALRAAEYFAEDAGASHAGLEPAGGVEIIGGAIAAAARPAGRRETLGAGIETAAECATAARDQEA